MHIPLLIVPRFASLSTCLEIRAAMNGGEKSQAEIHVDGYHVDDTVRRSFDVAVDDETIAKAERLIASAQSRVAAHFACALAGHEGPGFLRYTEGGFYRIHQDVMPGDAAEFARLISIVLFLTTARAGLLRGDCEGGALRLHPPSRESRHASVEIAPIAGTLVAFPAVLPHEVLPVTAGVRDVVVDWFY